MNKKFIIAVIAVSVAVLMLFTGCASQPASSTTVIPTTSASMEETEAISPNINVSGTGTIYVTPDMATIELGVVTNAKTAAEAEKNNVSSVNDTIAKLKELGIKEEKITTGNFYINPNYNYSENGNGTIVGYTVTTSLLVKVDDIKNVGKIYDETIKLGVNQSGNITFDISNRDEIYQDALKKAVDNAKVNADAIAQASGNTITRTLSITEQNVATSDVEMYRAAESAAAGVADTMKVMPGQMEITATVNVKYEIK